MRVFSTRNNISFPKTISVIIIIDVVKQSIINLVITIVIFPIADFFIFWEQGSTAKGRLFKVVDFKIDEERKEWMTFRVLQLEEQGTGWPT